MVLCGRVLGPFQAVSDGFSELFEVVKVMTANLKDDRPIDVLITMDGDVSESYRLHHALSKRGADDLELFQDLEILGHCRWRSRFSISYEMCGEVDAELDSPLEVQGDDILQVRIARELVGGRRSFLAIRSTQRRTDSSLASIRSRSMPGVFPQGYGDSTACSRPPRRACARADRHIAIGLCRGSFAPALGSVAIRDRVSG